MQIGILGTGHVGKTLATALVARCHSVMMGSRSVDNEQATAWAQAAGSGGSHGTFADAAQFGTIVINATSGEASLDALGLAGANNLANKPVLDVSNPIDHSKGMPLALTVANTDSLGERIQQTFPQSQVVKTLNTMTAEVMVNPKLLAGNHVVFVCGNDSEAKTATSALLEEFGWSPSQILDLGDITAARATESYLHLWIRLMQQVGGPNFNIAIVPAS